MIPTIKIDTIELNGDYTQEISLPKNSKIIDLVRRNIQGMCSYTLIYQYDGLDYPTSQYQVVFNSTGYSFELDRTYNYLTTVQQGYDESQHSIVYWRILLTDAEKRELKIDHLLT